MKHLFLLVFTCHFLSVSAQSSVPPTFSWVKTITFANSSSGAEVFDFYADAVGNSYVYGIFEGSLNFGNAIFLQTQTAVEGYFVAKYAPDGALLWAQKIVAPNGGAIYSGQNPGGIGTDAAGNVYISGQLSNVSLDFGGVVLQRSCAGAPMCSDLFVAKYNVDGQVQWVRQAVGTAGTSQKATSLVVGTDGTVFLAGNYEGQRLIFDELLSYTGLNTDGMYLARYSPDGTAISASFFDNGNSYSQLEHLAITRQNEVLATGYYTDEGLQFGNGISLEPFGSDKNYFIVRYNAQGEAQKAYNLHSDTYLDLLDVAADTAGHPYVVVDFAANLISGSELVATTPTADDANGILLHLIDSVFSPVVAVQYAGPTYPLANVAVDPHNRFFVAGYFSDAQLTVGDTMITNQGCDDVLLLGGSNDTLPLNWARSAGGIGCEAILSAYFGRTLATDQLGNLYTVGSFGDIMQLDGFSKTGNGLFIGKLPTGTVGTHSPTAANLDFQVSPNPSHGDFGIAVDDWHGPVQLSLYNAQGGVCYQRSLQQSDDLHFHLQLPSGLYTVVLVEKNKIGQQKLLIVNAF